jgi:PAS domain S-box-containing protein
VEGPSPAGRPSPWEEPPRSLPPPGLLWRALLEGAFDSIVIGTLEGRVVQASESFYELTGYEPEEVVGRPAHELGLIEREVHERAVEEVRRNGRSGVFESSLRTASGDIRAIAFTVQLVGGYLLSIVRDMTEARHAEQTARRLSAVTEAALAHLAVDDLLEELVVRVGELLQADRCGLLLLDEEAGELAPRAGLRGGGCVQLGRGFAARVARERRVIALDDPPEDELPEEGLRSLVGAPLAAHDRVLGVVYAGMLRPRRFTRDDEELLQLAADRAALGLQRALLARELRQLERLRARLSPAVWEQVTRS